MFTAMKLSSKGLNFLRWVNHTKTSLQFNSEACWKQNGQIYYELLACFIHYNIYEKVQIYYTCNTFATMLYHLSNVLYYQLITQQNKHIESIIQTWKSKCSQSGFLKRWCPFGPYGMNGGIGNSLKSETSHIVVICKFFS